MKFIQALSSYMKYVKKELSLFKLILKDPRTPKLPKLLMAIAIGYFISPVDLIPDFIPVLGQIDDIVIVPLLVYLSLKMIPKNIIEENRYKINELNSKYRIHTK